MNIFKSKKTETQQLDAATAVVSEEQGDMQFDETATEAMLLEAHLKADPAEAAALELASFQMTPGAKLLLDRAMDNIAQNTGGNIADPEFRAQVKQRAELFNAAGNDLSVVITALVDSCGSPTEAPGVVYSTCYNVLKAAVFIANLDYRRWADPKGDFDLAPYITRRVEDEALNERDFEPDARGEESPLDGLTGHDSSVDAAWHNLRSLYGQHIEDEGDVFSASLDDLRLFLSLTCDSFGWDPDRPLPFSTFQNPDGSFENITDAQVALDHAEVQRQESRKRKAERDALRLTAAAERAKQLVSGALKR